MNYKVHWLIDGLIEVKATDTETAEKIIKDKIEIFVKQNSSFFEENLFTGMEQPTKCKL